MWFMTSIDSRCAHGYGEQWQHMEHEGLDRFGHPQASMRIKTLRSMFLVYYDFLD
jgi:hypothetical protein